MILWELAGCPPESKFGNILKRSSLALSRLDALTPVAGSLRNFSELLAADTPVLVFGHLRRLGHTAREIVTRLVATAVWPVL